MHLRHVSSLSAARLLRRLAPGSRFVASLVLAGSTAFAQTGGSAPADKDQPAAGSDTNGTSVNATSADAQKKTAPSEVDLDELKRQLQVLAEEIEKLRSGEQEQALTDAEARALGLAPSAAAAYSKKRGVSFAGYGEMLYENFDATTESGAGPDRGSQLDFLRAILYAGYRFNDKFIFNSEIEIEHADEPSVEFAYVDYLASPNLTARGGMLLLPLGLVNEFHEPNVFLGARRPETETRIIPSTWRENGAGVLGTAGAFAYRAYLVNGLNAAGFSSDGLRGGRQGGSRARASDFGFAGRLDYTLVPGAFVGVGLYTGGADQGQVQLAGQQVDVTTTIFEVHGQTQARGFDVRGLYALADVDGAGALSAALHLSETQGIASRMAGGYVQLGYNLLSQATDRLRVTPYYRFEVVDTQKEMPVGFIADPSKDLTLHVIGLELRPIYSIVIKTDYQITGSGAETGRNQFNLALGYAF